MQASLAALSTATVANGINAVERIAVWQYNVYTEVTRDDSLRVANNGRFSALVCDAVLMSRRDFDAVYMARRSAPTGEGEGDASAAQADPSACPTRSMSREEGSAGILPSSSSVEGAEWASGISAGPLTWPYSDQASECEEGASQREESASEHSDSDSNQEGVLQSYLDGLDHFIDFAKRILGMTVDDSDDELSSSSSDSDSDGDDGSTLAESEWSYVDGTTVVSSTTDSSDSDPMFRLADLADSEWSWTPASESDKNPDALDSDSSDSGYSSESSDSSWSSDDSMDSTENRLEQILRDLRDNTRALRHLRARLYVPGLGQYNAAERHEDLIVRGYQAWREGVERVHAAFHSLPRPEVTNLQWEAMDAEYDPESEDAGESDDEDDYDSSEFASDADDEGDDDDDDEYWGYSSSDEE